MEPKSKAQVGPTCKSPSLVGAAMPCLDRVGVRVKVRVKLGLRLSETVNSAHVAAVRIARPAGAPMREGEGVSQLMV